jgi:3-methyladenine DNA glycosylase Mpg
MALNITKDFFNGTDSCAPEANLFFAEGEEIDKNKIILKKRIGIGYAEEDKDRLLRFSIEKNDI